MDEPQLEVENVESSTEKGLDEVLESAFTESVEKPMEVEDNTLNEEASTSAEVAATASAAETISEEILEKDAGEDAAATEDEAPAVDIDPDESLGPASFEKQTELDETANTEADQLDFTERSVNFSQLNVEHEDDSNDAFNALKKSETDALQTPKEESEEAKELDGDSKDSKDAEKQDQDSEFTAMDTDENVEPMDTNQPEGESNENADDPSGAGDKEIEESNVATSTADLDEGNDNSDGENDAALSEPNLDTEDVPDAPEGETEGSCN